MYKHEKINKLINEYRVENKRATYDDIASGMQISTNSLKNYASGKAKPTAEMLEKIALFFGKNVDHFFENQYTVPEKSPGSSIIKDQEPEYPREVKRDSTFEKLFEKIFEEQKETIKSQAETIKLQNEKILELSVENERLKNASAPVRDALAV